MCWRRPRCGFWFNGSGPASALALVNPDGPVSLTEASPGIVGSRTSAVQQCAEGLGLPSTDIRPTVGDTDAIGFTSVTRTRPGSSGITGSLKEWGMLGSKPRIAKIRQHLGARGIAREWLDRVHAPIGFNMHARSPEEISISILAELIHVRRTNPVVIPQR